MRFTGHPLEVASIRRYGRKSFNGMGKPIDGGPDILQEIPGH